MWYLPFLRAFMAGRTRTAAILLLALLLGGCQMQQRQPYDTSMSIPSQLTAWINYSERFLDMSSAEAETRLAYMPEEKPAEDFRLFHYALLNQQLHTRMGWIRARDSLRLLGERELSDELRVLVALLEAHNQQMINFDARQSRLQQQLTELRTQHQQTEQSLQESELRAQQLTQKIEALTQLENSMSIRRNLEQKSDAEKVLVPNADGRAATDNEGNPESSPGRGSQQQDDIDGMTGSDAPEGASAKPGPGSRTRTGQQGTESTEPEVDKAEPQSIPNVE